MLSTWPVPLQVTRYKSTLLDNAQHKKHKIEILLLYGDSHNQKFLWLIITRSVPGGRRHYVDFVLTFFQYRVEFNTVLTPCWVFFKFQFHVLNVLNKIQHVLTSTQDSITMDNRVLFVLTFSVLYWISIQYWNSTDFFQFFNTVLTPCWLFFNTVLTSTSCWISM